MDQQHHVGLDVSPSGRWYRTAERTMTRQDKSPDLIERHVVLAAVKDASRRASAVA